MAHVINDIFYFTYHVQHTCGIFVACVGPPGLCTLALLLNPQVIMQSLETCRQVPLCLRCTSSSQNVIQHRYTYMFSVLKDGRAFLGTLALDSNCIVWCTCCVVFALCALKLHIHPVDDCSFPFFSHFLAGPHISSCKLRPGTSILYSCWEHSIQIVGSMMCVCSSLAQMQWHDLPALRRRPAARLLIVVPCSLLSHPCSWYYTPSCSTMYCYPMLIGCSRPTVYGCAG